MVMVGRVGLCKGPFTGVAQNKEEPLAGQIHALDGLGVHGKPQQSIFAPLTFKPKICFTAQLRLSLLISG